MKKIKRLKKLLIVLLCFAMLQVPEFSAFGPSVVSAATSKSGLKKEKGKYYYYIKNARVKNRWVNVKGKKYYFGSNGAAYQATSVYGKTYNFVVKKINGKYYGFDKLAHMIKGIYVNDKDKFYYFNPSTGVYNSSMSKKLNNAAVYMKLYNPLKILLKSQKIKKKVISDSCVKLGWKDAVLTYDHYYVNYCYNPKKVTQNLFLGVWTR